MLEKMPGITSQRIVRALEALSHEPFPRGAVKLKGEEAIFRIRVGDYRILYEVHRDRSIIVIADIDHRSHVYQ